MAEARERLFLQGQQIWCNSRADGHSPDERETRSRFTCTPCAQVKPRLCALDLVLFCLYQESDDSLFFVH